MTPAAAAWAIVLVALLGLVILSVRHRTVRVPEKRKERLVRSPTHQAQVIALVDWLQQAKIVRTILENKVATAEGLQKTLEHVEGLSEEEVAATVGLLLRDRTVRRVIVAFSERERGLPPAAVRTALLQWAEPVKREYVQ